MAAPTFIGRTSSLGSGTTSVSVDFSSLSAGTVQAGDLLVIIVEQANQPISSITGFSKISPDRGSGTAGAAAAVGVQLFYKLVASGSETTVTVGDSGDHTVALGIVIRPDTGQTLKLDTSDGTDSQSIASASNIILDGVTTTAADAIVVLGAASDRDAGSSTNFGTVTNAALSSLAERHDQTVASGQGGGVGIWTGIKSTAGATGTTTVVNNGGATILFATMTAAFIYDAALTVGQSTETDSALALVQSQLSATGQANETDSALALGFPVAIGLAVETDTALALSYQQSNGVGLAVETDSAIVLAKVQLRSTGQSSETDTAFNLLALLTAGRATETDTALNLTAHQIVTVKLTTLGTGLSWLLPADCDTSLNITGYAVGAGGAGEDGVTSGRSGAGGGGGEVSPIDFSVSGLTRGVSTIPYRIGAGGIAAGIPAGGDTWLNKTGAFAPSLGSDGVLAKGGGGGSTGTGGAGGTGGVSPGTKTPGGAGGDGVSSTGSSSPGGGGGGAAGGGAGGISTSTFGTAIGGGGGGGTLPQAGGTSSTSSGGIGGSGSSGGAGGAGGDVSATSARHGRVGTDGTNWAISLGGSVGPGGGSGGGAGGSTPGDGGTPGLYGAGAGGGGCTTFGTSGLAGAGAQGVIVLTYLTVPPGSADPVGRSNETDSAQALSVKYVRATGLSTETDSARVLGLGLQAGRSTETDTAITLGRALFPGIATETDTSFSLDTVYDYVIDGLNGNDSNAGTPAAPWQSLNKINTIALAASSLVRVLVKNTATYNKVGDYLLRNGTGGQPGAGSTLEIYFESGVVMDGTLCNAVAPTAGAEFDGNNAHSTKLIGLGLLGLGGPIIQNYNSTSGGASPNGVGNRGLNTLDVYNFRVTGCIDGFSAHETAVLRTHDCQADDCSKSAFAHIDSAQVFAYRSSFYGKSGATLGIGAILNSASGYFENCNFIPATSDQALTLNNTTTLRCRIGTLTTSVELSQIVTAQTATDCFVNAFIDGNAKLTGRRLYGKFSTRCRSGGAIDIQHHIFSGPATSQSAIIFSSGSGLGSSTLIFKNGIVETATAAAFMTVNATYAGNMVSAACELDHNILSGSAAFDSDYTTAAGGTPTGTVSADALIGAANTTAMADYAFAAGSPAIGAASDSSDCGFGTSAIVSVGVPEAYALGISSETDTSLELGKVYLLSAALSLELDAALSLDDLAGGPAGLSLETDTSFELTKKFTIVSGLSIETDSAIALTGKQILLTSLAEETDAAFALVFARRFEVGRADEIDTASALDAKVRIRKPGRHPLRYRPRPKSRYRY